MSADRPPKLLASAFSPERGGGGSRQLGRIAIAEQTLAAVERGQYINGKHQIVDIGEDVRAAVSGTVLHEIGEPLRQPTGTRAATIEVTGESTLEAVARLAAQPGGHLACLNFASAKHPGGGFLGGAQAQEESLARSSALYPCLLRQRSYYERNKAHGSACYLDLAMFSPRVPVIRDDRGGWLERPVLASIVTCAAPNAAALRGDGDDDAVALAAALVRRAQLVLAVAVHHGVERFVLGAWGAGVFGNDPERVAAAFAALLEGPFAGAFAEIVFAVAGGPGSPNHDVFAARFARSRAS